MKFNLGCGSDIRPGYRNVDFRPGQGIEVVDLSKLPWPFPDQEAEEVLMLDFLEHFPYAKADLLLDEAWRILRPGGVIEVQVPDFEHCARAVIKEGRFLCNRCGAETLENEDGNEPCPKCGQTADQTTDAAIHRLYGGQDYPGNFHFNAFTIRSLGQLLSKHGFADIEEVQRNQNGETYYQNWNIKLKARKDKDLW